MSKRVASKLICLITGGTEGIGKATATQMAAQGFKVVLAARNLEKAEAVRAEIIAQTGGEVDAFWCDLCSLDSVRQLATDFQERYPRVDVLINNAGVFMPARRMTADGFEAT
jgi:NAD(P)-dependent dehydrogenase (short-subunit alcohol dehydrogenase family)